jgi:hypothetical protein
MSEQSLYERLGGVFAIAAVVDHFSDAVVVNPIVGQQSKNPALRAWHTENLGRLPGLKFMRTLWLCNVAGGPFQYTPTEPGSTVLGLEEAHRRFRISPESSTRWPPNWAAPSTPSGCPWRRRARCWQRSPLTRGRSPRDTSPPRVPDRPLPPWPARV